VGVGVGVDPAHDPPLLRLLAASCHPGPATFM
jgi:hypothetical protein